MSSNRNESFKRLGIIGGIILLALFLGFVTNNMQLVIDILSAIGLILIAISILVTIHELGHFLTAKAFGMRVETFSIGFPPKLFSFQKGETEYQIGATPLGGYVKISGVIDESFDTDFVGTEPKPYEFRSKPVWQRLIVMTGGVIMNVLLGIFIFSMMKFYIPETRLPSSEAKYGIEVLEGKTSIGSMIGFQTGDSIVSFQGKQYHYFDEYRDGKKIIWDDAYYEVSRKGKTIRLDVPVNIQNFFKNDTVSTSIFSADSPSLVTVPDSMRDNNGVGFMASPAYASGLRDGDVIIKLDSFPIKRFSGIRSFMRGKTFANIDVQVLRNDTDTLDFQIQTDSIPYLGVISPVDQIFKIDTIEYGFFEAFRPGTLDAFGLLDANIQGFKNLTNPGVEFSKSIMGPVQIAQTYLETFRIGGISAFIRLTGMLSMVLAFINILPIPALDGGHVVFLLIEAITRKEPSVKIRLIAQQIGMVLVLLLMVYILFNDVFQIT